MVFATAQNNTDVDRLTQVLLSPQRRRPHCVVTTRTGSDAPAFDAAGLAADCGDMADVTVVATGPLTWRLSEGLPELCGVYGGAARVYPTGTAWQGAPLLSPLRFIYSPADAPRARERLLEDALTMAATATGSSRSSPPAAAPVVQARVQGFIADGGRALVKTDADVIATISADLTLPGIPLDWYLTEGGTVRGRLQGVGLLEPLLSTVNARGVLAHFEAGAVTVALVKSVARQEAQLLLHPDVAVRVTRPDLSSNPRDLVSHLLDAGEVLPVRVVRDAQGRLALRLNDIEDDEDVQPALPLIDGGPPWLIAGRDLGTATAAADAPSLVDPPASEQDAEAPDEPPLELPAPAPSRPAPGPGLHHTGPAAAQIVPPRTLVQQLQGQLEVLKRENRRLRTLETEATNAAALRLELGQERARVTDLQEQLQREKSTTRDLRKTLRAGASTTRSPYDSRDRFDSPEAWIRHETHLAWIDRISADERRHNPLQAWSIGPAFADSVTGLTDGGLRKTLRAIVDVLTDRAEDLDGRELHQLREGLGGDDAPVVRPRDGASCWRVAIERNTPSARRLHYWRTPTGIELSRVVLHDDFNP